MNHDDERIRNVSKQQDHGVLIHGFLFWNETYRSVVLGHIVASDNH